MANSKDIKFDIRANLDTTSFDQKYDDMRKKLADLQKTSSMAQSSSDVFGNNPNSSRAKALFESQQRRQLDSVRDDYNNKAKLIQNQEKELSKVESKIKSIEESGKKNLASEKETNKLIQERSMLQDSITKKQADQFQTMSRIKGMGISPQGFRGVGENPNNPPPGTPPGAQPQAAQPEFIKSILRVMSVDQVVRGAMNTASYLVNRESGLTTERGQAASVAGKELAQTFGGGGLEQMYNLQERLSAATKASSVVRGRGALNLGEIGSGALTGAIGGAGIGSIIPGLGTMAGGLLGGIGGGLRSALGSEKKIANIFDQERFRGIQGAEFAKEYDKLLASEKAADPRKQLALQELTKSGSNNIALQRSLGMSDFDLFGGRGQAYSGRGAQPFDTNMNTQGWLSNQMRMGGSMNFTREDISSSAMGIIGAGGSTSAGTDLAGQSAKIQRDLRQTNASSILGRISGSGLQGSEVEAYKKILTSAVKEGVDTSKMPQELMRFADMATGLSTQGGGLSERASQLIGAGLAGTSSSQIAAAGTAYGEYQGRAREAGGMEGQLGQGFLMSSRGKSLFGNLSSTKANLINQTSLESLQQDPALLKGLAAQTGMTEDQILSAVAEKDTYKQTRTKGQEDSYRALGERIKGKSGAEVGELLKSDPELASLYASAVETTSASEGGFGQKGAAEKQASILMRSRGIVGDVGAGDMSKINRELGTEKQTVSELAKSATATGQLASIDNFNKYIDDLSGSAKGFSENAAAISSTMDVYLKALKEGAQVTEQFKTQMQQLTDEMTKKGYYAGKPGGN